VNIGVLLQVVGLRVAVLLQVAAENLDQFLGHGEHSGFGGNTGSDWLATSSSFRLEQSELVAEPVAKVGGEVVADRSDVRFAVLLVGRVEFGEGDSAVESQLPYHHGVGRPRHVGQVERRANEGKPVDEGFQGAHASLDRFAVLGRERWRRCSDARRSARAQVAGRFGRARYTTWFFAAGMEQDVGELFAWIQDRTPFVIAQGGDEGVNFGQIPAPKGAELENWRDLALIGEPEHGSPSAPEHLADRFCFACRPFDRLSEKNR
jgi:hypothetical protein